MPTYKVKPQRNSLKEAKTRIVIVGMSGSGKTWYAFESLFFALPPGWTKYSRASALKEVNIFFDTNNSNMEPDTFSMIRAYSQIFQRDVIITHNVDEFTRAFEAGLHHIIVAPQLNESTDSFRERVYEITDMVSTYQASLPVRAREPTYLFFDEVSALTPKMTESIVSETFTRGRILRIFPLALSQRPQMVAKFIYDESSYDIVFTLRTEHYVALRRSYGMDTPYYVQEDLAKTKHLYYVYDGHSWKRGWGKGKTPVPKPKKGDATIKTDVPVGDPAFDTKVTYGR